MNHRDYHGGTNKGGGQPAVLCPRCPTLQASIGRQDHEQRICGSPLPTLLAIWYGFFFVYRLSKGAGEARAELLTTWHGAAS